MFNKHHDQHVDIHNYNTIYPAPSQQQNGVTSAFAFGIVALVAICTIYVIAKLVLSTVVALAGVLTALIAGIVAIAPLVMAGAVIVVLLRLFFSAMPEAIEEVQGIRFRQALTRQSQLMLEVKDVSCIVLDNVPVRAEVER
mgnify:CR=1 FL=1